MKEQLISLETARLAKEKGFEAKLYTYYDAQTQELRPITACVRQTLKSATGTPYGQNTIEDYEAVLVDMDNSLDECILAPTQSLLQKWLRDEHSIHIEIQLSSERPFNQFFYRIIHIGQYFTLSHDDFYSESYEVVLEKALQMALKEIPD